MRLIKMFGLAAVAAVAAMAFIGATSASALNTQLCNSHAALTCAFGQGSTSVTMNNAHDGVISVLSDLVDILCLNVSLTGTPLALANPQLVHVTDQELGACGTTASHNNCEITVTELPLAHLNKTGLDTGSLLGLSGKKLIECENVDIFGTDIECEYDFTGLTFSVGAQHLTAFETPMTEIGSDFLCPNNPTLDGLLHTTANRYVLA
jgi:hypothetical protein